MPDVLNYASSRTGRRLNETIDWDLLGLSLVQIAAWGWFLGRHYYVRQFWGDRWSLFGFAWYYDRTNSYDPVVGIVASLIVTTTALLPITKRAIWYRVYLVVMLAAVGLHVAAGRYIARQWLPGVWGSLLMRSQAEGDRAPGFVLMLQPVFWVLLSREFTPRSLKLRKINILIALLLAVDILIVLAVLVALALVALKTDVAD